MGALSGGADRKKVRAMRAYGLNLGMAFQAVDDILDGDDKAIIDPGHLIEKSKAALKIFGRRAEKLKEIADSVINRNGFPLTRE